MEVSVGLTVIMQHNAQQIFVAGLDSCYSNGGWIYMLENDEILYSTIPR